MTNSFSLCEKALIMQGKLYIFQLDILFAAIRLDKLCINSYISSIQSIIKMRIIYRISYLECDIASILYYVRGVCGYIWNYYMCYYVCSAEETFLQDVLEILKRTLQNFKKILIKYQIWIQINIHAPFIFIC